EENECLVCFSIYDDKERRPRFMPCGHTLCSSCLEKAITENSKTCPKCRRSYTASNVENLPVNFSLMGLVTSQNTSDKFPECTEHLLPVSHKCTTHKIWVCESCQSEDHMPVSCKMIAIREELKRKKETQLDQSQPLLKTFEETCKKTDDRKIQCQKFIEENDKEIIRLETMVKRLQDEIQRKRTSKVQMENNYSIFDQKLGTIQRKRSSYDKAVTSLKSSETIRGVSKCSVEVKNETKKLQLVSNELQKEADLMMQVFYDTALSRLGLCLGNNEVLVKDGMHHLHVFHGEKNHRLSSQYLQFTDINDPPSTDGILTFMDFAWPDQKPRRVYMKMMGNTLRARQHLLLLTGQCGHSYRDLTFYNTQKQGQPGENIVLRPYDGKKATPLFNDVTKNDKVNHPATSGLITGAGWSGDNICNNALFSIHLKDDPGKDNTTGFGRVISGLDVIHDIVKSAKTDKIKVVDCGLVLF
ncbi:unnamed protein product, partial [Meganyctiphanes norvegica]